MIWKVLRCHENLLLKSIWNGILILWKEIEIVFANWALKSNESEIGLLKIIAYHFSNMEFENGTFECFGNAVLKSIEHLVLKIGKMS